MFDCAPNRAQINVAQCPQSISFCLAGFQQFCRFHTPESGIPFVIGQYFEHGVDIYMDDALNMYVKHKARYNLMNRFFMQRRSIDNLFPGMGIIHISMVNIE